MAQPHWHIQFTEIYKIKMLQNDSYSWICYMQHFDLHLNNSISILTIKTRLIFVYIYICYELIEETARRRKLIFGMWESFGYGSSKF